VAWLKDRGLMNGNQPPKAKIVATYDYVDEAREPALSDRQV
jgi:hypothetical protein